MTANKIKMRISEICTHFTFVYNKKNCGIDPLSKTNFDMWCGNKDTNVSNIDDVMNIKFFDGKSLAEIAEEIDIIDF